MALSILSTPGKLQPAYSVQEWELYNATWASETGHYYQIDISIAGETTSLKQFPDANGKAKIDIQNVLQAYFEMSVLTHEAFVLDYSTGILPYSITAYSKVGDSSTSSDTDSGYYVFGGVDQYNRCWDASTFLFADGEDGKFLSNWDTERDIHIEDDVYFQTFYGSALNSCLDKLEIVTYDGTDSSINVIDLSTGLNYTDDASIISFNLGPVAINAKFDASIITEDTQYYTIRDQDLDSQLYRVNIKSIDRRFNDYYRIFYVNSYGATEAFNFTLVPENTISISKTTYVNDRQYRSFGTKVEDKYKVTSNWVCEEVSKALKELWHTPRASLYKDNTYIPIIIEESSKTISNKWNMSPINYTLEFKYAEEYIIQEN